jgi:hypothetical protein
MDAAKVFNIAFRARSCQGQASRKSNVSFAYCTIGNSDPHLRGRVKERTPSFRAEFTTLLGDLQLAQTIRVKEDLLVELLSYGE